jgi:sugar phosphate permease
VGTGVAMFFVPAMKILTSWFSIAEFAAMTGLLMAMGGTGALGAAAPLALVSEVIGWRGSFEIVGVLTLLVAGAIWVYVRDTPEEEGLPPPNPVLASIPGRKKISIGQGMRMVLSEPRFWPLPVWFFCSCGVFFSYGGLWGGPYLMQVHGLTKGEAGSVLSMLAVSLIIGSPLVSVISDKWLKSRKKTIIGCAVMLLVLLIPPTLAPESMSVPMLYVWTLLFGFASGASVIVGFAAVKELFPLEIAGTAVGIGNFFPFFGAAIMQPLAGLILDSRPKGPAGYTPEAYGLVFAFFLVAAALALGAAFFVKETYGRQGA